MFVCVYMLLCASALGGQKGASVFLEQELPNMIYWGLNYSILEETRIFFFSIVNHMFEVDNNHAVITVISYIDTKILIVDLLY